MADEQTPKTSETEPVQGAPGQPQGANFLMQKLYLKDVSFESPAAPDIFREQGQPDIGLNMQQNVSNLGEDNYEVVLSVTVTCKVGERTAYLCEVKQAGVFHIAGFEPAQHGLMVGAYCPNVLFPYARQVISDMVAHGGFAPLVLQPINFEQVYAEQLRQRAAQSQPSEGIESGQA